MKKAHLISLLCLVLSACGTKDSNNAKLEGKIDGLGNDTIYLYGIDKLYDHIDTIVVKDNQFSASLPIDTLTITMLKFSNGVEYPLFINKRNQIQIEGTTKEMSSLQINGNPENQEMTSFNSSLNKLYNPLSKESTETTAENFINSHPSSLVSMYLLDHYFIQKPQPDFNKIDKIVKGMAGELKDRPYMSKLLNTIQNSENSTIGKTAPYFHTTNLKGESINRLTFKDKTLLIHFWASWDSTSRKSNQMYRHLYRNNKKNSNLALLGISLDMNKKSWNKAIKEDTLKWEQGCDLSGWESDVVKQFAIQRLPANILISPDGKIEGRNLNEADIENKLKEIKGEKTKKQK